MLKLSLEQKMAELRTERDGLQRLIFEGAQVQRKLTAPRYLRRGEFEIAGEIFPVRQVSGDFLATFDVGSYVMLAIGDIAGKGLAAGMWFTHIVGLVRMLAVSLPDPAAVLDAINNHLVTLQPEPPTATLFLGRLDPATGELLYCNGGHPAPLVLQARDRLEWLEAGGPLLGVVPNAQFKPAEAILNPEDVLIAYSDGVLESCNCAGEFFGRERLLRAACAAERTSVHSLLFTVLAAAQDFAGREPGADDIAMLAVRHFAEGISGD